MDNKTDDLHELRGLVKKIKLRVDDFSHAEKHNLYVAYIDFLKLSMLIYNRGSISGADSDPVALVIYNHFCGRLAPLWFEIESIKDVLPQEVLDIIIECAMENENESKNEQETN